MESFFRFGKGKKAKERQGKTVAPAPSSLALRPVRDAPSGPDRQPVYGAESERDTIAGAEREPTSRSTRPIGSIDGASNPEDRAIDSGRTPPTSAIVKSHPIEPSVGLKAATCSWPCQHHEHATADDANFEVVAADVMAAARGGCATCALLNQIARERCACGRSSSRGGEGVHPYTRFVAFMVRRKLITLETHWSCGKAELEIAAVDKQYYSPFPPLPEFGTVHEDRLSADCIATLKHWLDVCDRSHPKCSWNRNSEPLNPTWLLDVVAADDKSDVKLVHNGGLKADYIALSYCWGGRQPLTTTVETLNKRRRDISWASMPQTFRDTVLLARSLGFQKVWIDALCIVQDDPVSKEQELARMRDIFQCASVVVIAAEALTPYDGIFGDSDAVEERKRRWCWSETLVRYGKLGQEGVKFRSKLHTCEGEDACIDSDGAATPIATRAWTYQERLIAHRCLIFRRKEIIWECRTLCTCECGFRSGFKPQLLPWAAFTQASGNMHFWDSTQAHEFWRDAVEDYSARKITWRTDRLPAISALAAALSVSRTGDYLAGIWRRDFVNQLKWKCKPPPDRSRYASSPSYIAPSWSWAASPLPVSYHLTQRGDIARDASVTYVDACCTPLGANTLGEVRDGFILLRGIHCYAQAAVEGPAKTGRMVLKLVLEHRAIYTFSTAPGDLAFLDGLHVRPQRMSLSTSGEQVQTLQREYAEKAVSYCPHPPCSGLVRLLWTDKDTCLLLAYSMRVSGAFERIGILDGNMCPAVPSNVKATDIRLV